MRRSDTGPFAIIPEWVLDGRISDRAVRLYCILARYADDNGESWPSRRTLWERLRCSERSLDAAVKELEGLGALTHECRRTEAGAPTSNLWILRRVWGGGAKNDTTWGKKRQGGGAGIAALTRTNERDGYRSAKEIRESWYPDEVAPPPGWVKEWTS